MTDRHIATKALSTEQQELAHLAPDIRNAALLEYQTGESAKAAVATIDNSKAVKGMFPNDPVKQESAYRALMTVQHIPGYPSIEIDDMANLNNNDISKLRAYSHNYKPSVALSRVDAGAQELTRLGFPKMAVPTDSPANADRK